MWSKSLCVWKVYSWPGKKKSSTKQASCYDKCHRDTESHSSFLSKSLPLWAWRLNAAWWPLNPSKFLCKVNCLCVGSKGKAGNISYEGNQQSSVIAIPRAMVWPIKSGREKCCSWSKIFLRWYCRTQVARGFQTWRPLFSSGQEFKLRSS